MGCLGDLALRFEVCLEGWSPSRDGLVPIRGGCGVGRLGTGEREMGGELTCCGFVYVWDCSLVKCVFM